MYASALIQKKHQEAIEFIKSQNGLIRDGHRTNGMIQLTHVGLFRSGPAAKNPKLVALIDGVLFCINPIDIFGPNGTLGADEDVGPNVELSTCSCGGVVQHVSLTIEERCKLYSEDPHSLGEFLEIIQVKTPNVKAA